MGERTWGFWKRRTGGPGRKVALHEPGTRTPAPSPVVANELQDDGRRAARRRTLLAGLLWRGRGDAIDP
jgi:hypothetical protein